MVSVEMQERVASNNVSIQNRCGVEKGDDTCRG